MTGSLNSFALSWLDTIYSCVWGAPLLVLLMGIGIYLTIRLKGLQFRLLGYALKLVFGPQKNKDGAGMSAISSP